MNSAIRAVVRTGLKYGWEVIGVQKGYSGLIEGNFVALNARDVGGIIQQGGTILGSSRCPEFKTEEGRQQALLKMQEWKIDALVVIGGNGSQAGAYALSQMGFPVVGVASTIDNDLYGSDITIGVDTALDVALEAIDRLKVTASSHNRVFLVEVMGRDCGYLALMTGLAGGAEGIVIPEVDTDLEALAVDIRSAYERGKAHALVVVAEGARFKLDNPSTRPARDSNTAVKLDSKLRGVEALAYFFQKHQERLGFDLRTTTLGHVQRGGSPGAFDRLLATRLGAAATQHLVNGENGILVGLLEGEIAATPLAEVVANERPLELGLLELSTVLAR
jgi:6-phosphofructokinase 1